MEAQRGVRPSSVEKPRRYKRKRSQVVGLLAERRADGRDLWTGEKLVGEDARQWVRSVVGLGEREKWGLSVQAIGEVREKEGLLYITLVFREGEKTICVKDGGEDQPKEVRLVG